MKVGTKGLAVAEVRQEKEKWRIIGVYVDKKIETVTRKIESWIDRRKGNHKTLIGGDFNARTER